MGKLVRKAKRKGVRQCLLPGLRERLWQRIQKRIVALEDEDSKEDVCLTHEKLTLLAARSNTFAGIAPRKIELKKNGTSERCRNQDFPGCGTAFAGRNPNLACLQVREQIQQENGIFWRRETRG